MAPEPFSVAAVVVLAAAVAISRRLVKLEIWEVQTASYVGDVVRNRCGKRRMAVRGNPFEVDSLPSGRYVVYVYGAWVLVKIGYPVVAYAFDVKSIKSLLDAAEDRKTIKEKR